MTLMFPCVVSFGCYFEEVRFHADFSELYALVFLLCEGLPVFLCFCSVKAILILDLVMTDLASSLVMKGAWLPLMTLDFIDVCLLTTSVYFVTKESNRLKTPHSFSPTVLLCHSFDLLLFISGWFLQFYLFNLIGVTFYIKS